MNSIPEENQKSQAPEERTLEKQPSTEIIPPALDTALRTAGVDTRDPKITKAIEISLLMFSGSLPLPPPMVIAEYNSAFPGLVEKIVAWTEEQRQHRMKLERMRTEGSEARFNRGQWIAGTVALGGLVLASIVSVVGNPWVAAVIAIVAVGGPTAAVAFARYPSSAKPALPPNSPAPPPVS